MSQIRRVGMECESCVSRALNNHGWESLGKHESSDCAPWLLIEYRQRQYEQVRGLHRHVAIDAVGSHLRTELTNHSTLIRAVTLNTSGGIIRGCALWSVNIMASGASHLR